MTLAYACACRVRACLAKYVVRISILLTRLSIDRRHELHDEANQCTTKEFKALNLQGTLLATPCN